MEIDLDLRWRVVIDGEVIEMDELLFVLLHGVLAAGQLNAAASAASVSYRHAWGLLRRWERRLGRSLLSARQGRGAELTNFAVGLLQARSEAEASLDSVLSKAALTASATIDAALKSEHRKVRIASSHDDSIVRLREYLESDGRTVTLEVVGSEGALRQYRRGEADLAGFHLPLGTLGRTVAAKLIGLLDEKQDEVFLVEHRTLGLMSRPGHRCNSLAELIDGRLRFVNRQAGSATRLTFDGLLGGEGLAPGDILGYRAEEYTHTAVAALVVSGDADVAFGSKNAAERFNLFFVPMVEERFYLAFKRRFDNNLRQYIAEFSRRIATAGSRTMKPDELVPTIAVIKRVHKAGFWKSV